LASTKATTTTPTGGLALPGLLLGSGLGGLFDGIVLHQILQWHHMLTDYGGHASFPTTTVPSLEDNTLWDGLFHAATWVFVVSGLLLLWRAVAGGRRWTWRSLVGLILAGWGLFNLVEGIVNHHIVTVHRVRDDAGDPLAWDLGFLALGAVLVVVGMALRGRDRELTLLEDAATAASHSRPKA
jgi:uncharacterized membrane protein